MLVFATAQRSALGTLTLTSYKNYLHFYDTTTSVTTQVAFDYYPLYQATGALSFRADWTDFTNSDYQAIANFATFYQDG